jgi:SMC interacting uncharacterized protein involved in chromosome segregation
MKSYNEYKYSIVTFEDLKKAVEEARAEYSVQNNISSPDYTGIDIPFNLEQEYFDRLIESKKYTEAENLLEKMKHSYNLNYHNFMESMEYRMKTFVKTDELIKDALTEAKKEFNQQTITLISIIVGIITIFGTANQVFKVNSFSEGIATFLVICSSLIATVATALIANSHYRK